MNKHVTDDPNASNLADIESEAFADAFRGIAPQAFISAAEKRPRRGDPSAGDLWMFAVFGICKGLALAAGLLILALAT